MTHVIGLSRFFPSLTRPARPMDLGKDFIHDPSRQNDFPIGNRRCLPHRDALIKAPYQFRHAEILIESATNELQEITACIPEMLPRVLHRWEEEGEIALVTTALTPDQATTRLVQPESS